MGAPGGDCCGWPEELPEVGHHARAAGGGPGGRRDPVPGRVRLPRALAHRVKSRLSAQPARGSCVFEDNAGGKN